MAYSASDVAFPHTITVVIQTRDRPRLAARAVQRVFDQDGFDPALLDVVVVDDGSRVDPPDPSRSEANAKVRVIRHHESQGTGPARKSGATAGRGEFIAFLGDHGILLPDKLTTIVRAMNESPPHADVSLHLCAWEHEAAPKQDHSHESSVPSNA